MYLKEIRSTINLKTITQTSPSCSDIIMDCNWLGLTEPCTEYFSFLPTDDGMCCTFNGYDSTKPVIFS